MGLTFNLGRVSPSVFTDSSLNVGIGAAPSGTYKLDVTGTGRFTSTLLVSGALTGSAVATFTAAANPLILKSTSATTMYTEYYYNTSTLSGYIGSGSGILSGANNSDFIIRSEADFVVATGNNRRMTITSGGNVGIGATPLENLWVKIATNVNFAIGGTTRTRILGVVNANDNFCDISLEGLNVSFFSNGSERARITSGGAVYINTTSALPGSGTLLHVDSPTAGPSFKNATTGQQSLMLWNAVSSGDNLLLEFNVNTTIAGKGSVDYNRASNVIRYNTTSDANLKNIIGDSNLEKSIDILNSTRIREYSWKEDETNKPQIGVIAQELYETFKGAVSVGSDKELLGTEDYKNWGVDKTAFTFHLIAGWQKHEQIINDLQAQIQELSNRLNKLENK